MDAIAQDSATELKLDTFGGVACMRRQCRRPYLAFTAGSALRDCTSCSSASRSTVTLRLHVASNKTNDLQRAARHQRPPAAQRHAQPASRRHFCFRCSTNCQSCPPAHEQLGDIKFATQHNPSVPPARPHELQQRFCSTHVPAFIVRHHPVALLCIVAEPRAAANIEFRVPGEHERSGHSPLGDDARGGFVQSAGE